MFAKLKKKIAEEAATAPRTGARIPRSASKESITSGGADSGDDFASDGSSSRDDLSSQVLRRNDQVRRLEAKLTDYAEQLRILQKTKEKVEFALEKHQDSSMRKLQEQNESNQAGRAKMAEGLTLALEKRDQEWMEKMGVLEKEKEVLRMQVEELTEKSLTLFQKRDDRDELETFQQQELAKVKHMLLRKEEQLSQREKELEGKEDRGERQDQRPSSDPLATTCTSFTTSSPAPPPGPAPLPGLATPRRPTSTCTVTVTNTSDLNDSREINFEYLKHVVLKFMSCREAEAFHLIRAVSVLLNFTREEEDLLKKTLEYKMSWFGSKPSPKGSIRPSISGAAAQWS
uniref:Golgin subfamily A member 1 n=1 Tax=Gadus morhua TaxID=8049 RepID=A0A8C4ZFL3_GADMO